MEIEKITEGNCITNPNLVPPKTGRISLREAKLRYLNRLNPSNPVDGYMIDFEVLKTFVNSLSSNIKYIRIWKGARRVEADCSSGETINLFMEDLIFVPVGENDEDLYVNDTSLDINNKDDVNIISTSRPCPEWCNVNGLERPNKYFHQNPQLLGTIGNRPQNPTNEANPYPDCV